MLVPRAGERGRLRRGRRNVLFWRAVCWRLSEGRPGRAGGKRFSRNFRRKLLKCLMCGDEAARSTDPSPRCGLMSVGKVAVSAARADRRQFEWLFDKCIGIAISCEVH